MGFSVVIPAYNAEAFIEVAVASALPIVGQFGGEVLVVDDGSHDATAERARKCGARVVSHRVNRGIPQSLNTGLNAATADVVGWLSADDFYVAAMSEAVKLHLYEAEAAITFCDYGTVDQDGERLRRHVRPWLISGLRPGLVDADLLPHLLCGCFINGSTTIMDREYVMQLGGFPEEYRYGNDYALWLKACLAGAQFAYHNEVVGMRRIHERQLSASDDVSLAVKDETARLFRELDLPNSYADRLEAALGARGSLRLWLRLHRRFRLLGLSKRPLYRSLLAFRASRQA